MKKLPRNVKILRILSVLLVSIGLVVLTPSTTHAQSSCENRSKNCPVDKYPDCEKNVGVCSAPACMMVRFEGGKNIIDCAYPAEAETPTGPNTCGWDSKGNKTNHCSDGYNPVYDATSCICWPEGVSTPTPQPQTPVNDSSCPVCPRGFVWSRTENICIRPRVAEKPEYRDPVQRLDCSGENNCVAGCGCGTQSCDLKGGPLLCASGAIQTGLGCIPVGDTGEFAAWFLRWALGIAGGIAFLLILFAGFRIMTASGNPEQLQGGRELLTAAIAGLILVIFSVFLLRIIGVEILGLPGFNP